VAPAYLNLPAEKLRLLQQLSDRLRNVPNIAAIVLGGSYAQGLAGPDSDLDMGLYYRAASPFSLEDIRSVALSFSEPGTVPIVTGFYEWGRWVNGGAWIKTPEGKVDFLYKNLNQIEAVLEDGRCGIWSHDYDQQPPYGFRSIVYFAETRICIPLHDPAGEIARLKSSVSEYPPALKDRIVQDCLWGAEFTLLLGHNFAAAADVYSSVGSMTRVAQFLMHAIFALNEQYFVNDKHASRLVDTFARQPREFSIRLARVLAAAGSEPAALLHSLEDLQELWQETVQLTNGAYEARYSSGAINRR
jgi:hypothetical protein